MEKIWFKNYVKGVPQKIRFQDTTLPDALKRSATRYPKRTALWFRGKEITFKELDEMAGKIASSLHARGLGPGSNVGILLPNLVQAVVGIYGTLRAGATAVMLNPRDDDVTLKGCLSDVSCDVVFCLDVLVPRLIGIRKKTKLKTIVSCHIRDYLPFMQRQVFPIAKKNLHLNTPKEHEVIEFSDLLKSGDLKTRLPEPKMDDTAFIMFTSGTTGLGKAVELSHRNVSCNCQQVRSWFPNFKDGNETVVACIPFFHVFGLTCALNVAIFYGFSVVLVPLPEPKNIFESIAKAKATFIPALPTLYNAYVHDRSLRNLDLSSLTGCFSGGAPLPLETVRAFEEATRVRICEGYGLTESSPATHINPHKGKTKVGTIGLPLPNTDAKIVDFEEEVEITEPGVPGELHVKGPQVMKGYRGRPEFTEAVIRDGWLKTGDIAVRDEEGYFSIIDRRKDMIVCKGEPIFPRDIEEILYAHPKIEEACVIGIPDQTAGERPKAYVVVKKGERFTAAEILTYCKGKMDPQKSPWKVEIIDELPKSPVGKILRKEVRRMHLLTSSPTRTTLTLTRG